ncbi:cytochrome BD ubiquinol oxidase subunit II [Alkalilimnicola ehrlichii]|uniref:Cytochrome BD ubiquinol oxidase subunit II n=1 Tax=Alkalilimnicola ehrlichii TaxID=351052 RepID=A0A3E0X344_9GAMM|nr:cytochrome d ubiquinol oxidase subunit II [Alkalilimnicola ehrlichii]RFA30946.1 cytochrome BD ubiquinol oxidase subunit II [Alkalilimnicola ehrlichii]RFA38896.1 cytochrome BD ubiquinol oxidase subunit II [Alkalilimnicola ehrlichii]
MDFPATSEWLPVAFLLLLGVSVLIYVILDGFDLGVGMLLGQTPDDHEKDLMVASIGPFWDANETWLVLAVGIVLVAFPMAQGEILTALYLPVAIMLGGLILRGVAFDFRVKVPAERKWRWNLAFTVGSWIAALAQGYMLGRYVMGLESSLRAELFAAGTAVCVAAAYRFIGAAWLIYKTHGGLQQKSLTWARQSLLLTGIGLIAVSVGTPLFSQHVFDVWFSLPNLFLLAPIPIMTFTLVGVLLVLLRKMPFRRDAYAWLPFAGAVAIFVLAFHGLAFSFYPYIVLDQMTIWEAAAAPGSLMLIFIGAMIQLPILAACTLFVHRVFGGKATKLEYY